MAVASLQQYKVGWCSSAGQGSPKCETGSALNHKHLVASQRWYEGILNKARTMECVKAHHLDRPFMVKNVFTTAVNGTVYIISSIRRVRGLFSMQDKSAVDPAVEGRFGDAARVLGALRSLQARNEVGATRAEIAAHLNEPAIDVTAILGILQGEGLVVCEGTTGYPAQACWRSKDKT